MIENGGYSTWPWNDVKDTVLEDDTYDWHEITSSFYRHRLEVGVQCPMFRPTRMNGMNIVNCQATFGILKTCMIDAFHEAPMMY